MAHFAKINDDNIVEQVLVVPDSQEHRGEEFLAVDLQLGGRWLQTSFNSSIRGAFAVIGSIYREDIDVFHSPEDTGAF